MTLWANDVGSMAAAVVATQGQCEGYTETPENKTNGTADETCLAHAAYTIQKAGTTLRLTTRTMSVAYGAQWTAAATLTVADGRPIESETVFFIVAPTGGGAATVVTTTTSPDGTATAVGLVLPIGSYNVTVRFGENITAPIVYDATSSRYAGSHDDGTVAVTRAPLTIKANDASRRFGNANPTFTGTITGLAPGDNISATYSTTATGSSLPDRMLSSL